MSTLPTIGVLFGDPSGIGPELIAKLLSDPAASEYANLFLIRDRTVHTRGEAVAKKTLDLNVVDSIATATFIPGQPSFLPVSMIADTEIEPGKVTTASGNDVFSLLGKAAAAAKAGELEGILFAPLNNAAMRLGGLLHEDEQRYLQEVFEVRDFACEFNVTGRLWTSRVASRVPLREVANSITHDGVCDAVTIIDRSLKAAGIVCPRIGVAALNPHAGDGGPIGRKEIETIAPAVETMKARASMCAARCLRHCIHRGAEGRVRRGGVDVPRPGANRDDADGLRAWCHSTWRPAGARDDVCQRHSVRHRWPGHRQCRGAEAGSGDQQADGCIESFDRASAQRHDPAHW